MKKLLLIFLFPIILQAQLLTLLSESTEITYADTARSFNYYVDNTGTGDTLSTIAEVNALSLQGLDTVFFKRGCEWREQLTVPSSGVEGYPIVFASYGIGNKPIINGADTTTGWELINFGADWSHTLGLETANNTYYNFRQVIDGDILATSGTQIRIKITAHSSSATNIDGASIGIRSGTTDDFGSSPTRITFNGNDAVDVAGGDTVWSDWINFSLDETNDYLVHIFSSTKTPYAYVSSGDVAYRSADSTSDNTLTSTVDYGSSGVAVRIVSDLEVRTPIWVAEGAEYSLISGLGGNYTVVLDDSICTELDSINALTSEYTTFIDTVGTDSIYVYSETDPDTRFAQTSARQFGVQVYRKSYVKLEDLSVKYAGSTGINFDGGGLQNYSGSLVDRCYAYGNRINGMRFVRGYSNSIIEDSYSSMNGNGFYSSYESDNNIFRRDTTINNILYSNVNFETDGHGIASYNSSYVTVEYCYGSENDGGSLGYDSEADSVASGIIRYNNFNGNSDGASAVINIGNTGTGSTVQIYYNKIERTTAGMLVNVSTSGGGLNFYNNTMIQNGAYTTMMYLANADNISMKNNIYYNNGATDRMIWAVAGTLTSDNNVWYNTKPATYYARNAGGSYATLSAWQTASSQDANSYDTDPSFTTEFTDLSLQAGSDAINNGATLNIPAVDILGNPLNGQRDIGAFEKQ